MRPLTDEEAVKIHEELIKLAKKSISYVFVYFFYCFLINFNERYNYKYNYKYNFKYNYKYNFKYNYKYSFLFLNLTKFLILKNHKFKGSRTISTPNVTSTITLNTSVAVVLPIV